jgi:cysteine dioxygenase
MMQYPKVNTTDLERVASDDSSTQSLSPTDMVRASTGDHGSGFESRLASTLAAASSPAFDAELASGVYPSQFGVSMVQSGLRGSSPDPSSLTPGGSSIGDAAAVVSAAAPGSSSKHHPRSTVSASRSIAHSAGIDIEAAQPLVRDSFRRELAAAAIQTDYFSPSSSSSATAAAAAAPVTAPAALPTGPTLGELERRCPAALATAAAPAVTVGSLGCRAALAPVSREALHAAAAAAAAIPVSTEQSLAALRASGVRTREALDLDELARAHTHQNHHAAAAASCSTAAAAAEVPERLSNSSCDSLPQLLSPAATAAAAAAAESAAIEGERLRADRFASAADTAALSPEPVSTATAVASAIETDWSHTGVPARIAALRDCPAAPLTMPQLVLVIKALMQDGPARADLRKVASAMARYDASCGDWRRYAFCDDNVKYTRNLVTTDNRYWTLLLLCWNPARESPVHNHPDCECFVRCVAGAVTETLYAWPSCGATSESPLERIGGGVCGPGTVTFMNDSKGLHKLGNDGAEIAYTLHLYFPPYQRFKMFLDCTAKASEGSSCFHSKYGALQDNLAGLGLCRPPALAAKHCTGASTVVAPCASPTESEAPEARQL